MHRNQAFSRINILLITVIAVTALIILRLFQLQILSHKYYAEIAQSEQQGYTTLPARRGEILIEDYHSGEVYKLATNTTLNMIYADPTLIDDSQSAATMLAPFLFDLEIEQEIDQQRYDDEYEQILEEVENETLQEEALSKLTLKTDDELFEEYQEALQTTLAEKTRDVILINSEPLIPGIQEEIQSLNLTGFELSELGNLYAYPAQILDKASAARSLAEVFNTDAADLESILLGKNRFVVLKRQLDPTISQQIETILLEDRDLEEPLYLGIRMQEEYFRFYPEQEIASQVLGYTDGAGKGQYGIENSYNDILQGTDGIFTSQIDAYGNQITVGESIIEQAEDGADVTLTIDRAIQLQVERILADGVWRYRADAGQAIVMNPQTGEILAMAHAPTFNPNEFGEVYQKVPIEFTEEEEERIFITGDEDNPKYWFYKQIDPDVRIEIFPDPENEDLENPDQFLAYENEVGPEVYKNKLVQEAYEPGSIFKPLTMAAAINAGEVTPNTTFVDDGPVPVDFNVLTGEYDFQIKTSDNKYRGILTMTQVLEYSSNTGMAFVVRALGPALFYNYLDDFGFLERTEIGLEDEVLGKVEHYDAWTESEMITKAFGQGLTLTPLQLVQAYSAIANHGQMVRPQLVKKIEYADGTVETFDTEILGQVITQESAEMVLSMMAATGESYIDLALEDHYFGAKSGTAQTYKHGQALSGPGTTIASFVGFGPIDNPQFLVLVKLDRPRAVEWGAATAGPISSDIYRFLYDYYSIPPDK